MLTMEEISDAAGRLIRQLGETSGFAIDAIPGGANNRVFRIHVEGRSYFLKCYRRHPEEPLDRLSHDWSFSSFAWQNGFRNVAQPLVKDEANALGLFGFVDGKRLAPYEIESNHLQDAAGFFRDLNRFRRQSEAAALPFSYEAGFSVDAILSRIDSRVQMLQQIIPSSPASEAALALFQNSLQPKWNSTCEAVTRQYSPSDRGAELSTEERCLSPVDFGLHNTLALPDGKLLFHDFEYAGWDDPARMACDFFCQMQLPAPKEFADEFLTAAFAEFLNPEEVRQRASALWPAFRIHWICTVLTDFLPPSLTRPRYAGQPPSELRKTRQLEMAELLLSRRLNDPPWSR